MPTQSRRSPRVTRGDGQHILLPLSGQDKPPSQPLLGPEQPGAPQRGQAWLHPCGRGSWWLPCPVLPRVLLPHTDSCSFALHAQGSEPIRFSTPGFPDSPYPSHARCQWTLRGDADSVLSLTFRSFDVSTCDERGSDLVMVYDTLSPVEPRAVVQ